MSTEPTHPRPEPAPWRDDAEALATIAGFRDLTLPKAEWTHRAHLTAGLWFLERFGLPEARRLVPEAIRTYNVASGGANTATAGYHETITQFYLSVIEHHRRNRGATTIGAVSEGFARRANLVFEVLGARDLPLRHYSAELLWSIEARARWVAPDLAPVDGS